MIFKIVLLFIAVLIYFYYKFKRKFDLSSKIPGPWFVPFLGNIQFAILTAETLFKKLNELQRQHENCFRMWLGTSLWVFFHNPKDVHDLLNNREFVRVDEFHQLHPLIGSGLLLSDGNRWSLHRKALSHAFSSSILKEFFPAISRHADVLVSKLNTELNVEITDYLLLCVLDTICETSMGAHINAQMDSKSAYVEAFHNASHILFKRMSNPLLSFDFIFRRTPDYKRLTEAIETLHALTDNIIERKRRQIAESSIDGEEKKPNKSKKLVLLDVLMQCEINGHPFIDQQIRDHVNTFLFAGIDTTKSAISFLLYNIAKHPNVQDRLFREIVSTLGTDPNQEIYFAYLAELPYLDAVLKESLRFHTAVPVSARKTTKEITIGSLTYPKDTALWINIYGMCHDPKIYKDPDQFRPERFLNGEWQEKLGEFAEYAFIPYSAGPRYCIGKQYSLFIMKTIVIKILLNYEIKLTNPDDELILMAEMVLKSKNGINLKFLKR